MDSLSQFSGEIRKVLGIPWQAEIVIYVDCRAILEIVITLIWNSIDEGVAYAGDADECSVFPFHSYFGL